MKFKEIRTSPILPKPKAAMLSDKPNPFMPDMTGYGKWHDNPPIYPCKFTPEPKANDEYKCGHCGSTELYYCCDICKDLICRKCWRPQ